MTVDEIIELRCLNYKWNKIATLLGQHCIEDCNISSDGHIPLSNHQLDELIHSIKQNHHNDGEVLMKDHLVRLGLRVTLKELREFIHQVDHVDHQLYLLISLMLFLYIMTYLITSDLTVEERMWLYGDT